MDGKYIFNLSESSRGAAVDVATVIKRCFTIPRFTKPSKKIYQLPCKQRPRSTIPQRLAYAREKSCQKSANRRDFLFLDVAERISAASRNN